MKNYRVHFVVLNDETKYMACVQAFDAVGAEKWFRAGFLAKTLEDITVTQIEEAD